ncbi:MAG: 5'-methylthioadenosine/adenosylhomocysteine nucleosidase [Phycisphaerae bacterium]|nr:5'-methylthioadenosine/adenosylhomocysteine nucleosidase [Phycisphaerae bacterium]
MKPLTPIAVAACCILLPAPAVTGADSRAECVTAILGAMEIETTPLLEAIEPKRYEHHLNITFTIGRLKGRKVVVADTGVGKVNAAMTTTLLLDHYRPSEVIFTGIAGSANPELRPGDLVIGAETTQHDLRIMTAEGNHHIAVRNPLNAVRNPRFIPADKRLLAIAKAAGTQLQLEPLTWEDGKRPPRFHQGVIASGDSFVAVTAKRLEIQKAFRADAVEMEGAAVAQICFQQDVPCLVIRGLSDRADEQARQDMRQFRRVAAYHSASLAMKIVELLASEHATTQGKTGE